MAEADWSALASGLSSTVVRRGVTNGVSRPNGGGNFVYAWNSVSAGINGAAGLYYNAVNFAPMAKGGRITGALKRMPSGGPEGFSPFLFIGLQGSDVANTGYLLGLQDDDPSKIALRKGALNGGIMAGIPGENGILRVAVDSVDEDEWVHVRLDMVANTNGDVILKVFQNDLGSNPVTAPVWAAIDGMSDYIDDALGIASGSLPYTSGRVGFAFSCLDITRRAAADHVEVARQL